MTDRILNLILIVPIFLPALVIHEYAHAWAAYKCGDPTAKEAGRLTLDPVAHFDPLGALMILVMFLSGIPFLFGWAKPVPVRFGNLRNPLRDMMLVAVAGPATNALQALVWYLVLWIVHWTLGPFGFAGELARQMAIMGIGINLMLMAFNLMPIPPLDGSRIAVGLFPSSLGEIIARAEPYGFMIIMILLATGVFGKIASPVYSLIDTMVRSVG